MLVLLAVVVVAIVVVPLLLFGVELVLLGLLVAAGIVGRTLLGRPWIVQAPPLTAKADDLSWQVVGWRRSNRVIDEVVASLRVGLDPSPAEASEPVPTMQLSRVTRRFRRNSETAPAVDAAIRASQAGTSDDDARP